MRFYVGGRHVQFQALPFDLSTAPQTFIKVLVTVVVEFRNMGMSVFHYLDDILIMAESARAVGQSHDIMIEGLQRFGWLLNLEKSHLIPSQNMVYLGAEFDTQSGVVRLSWDRIARLRDKIRRFSRQRAVTAQVYSSLLGCMLSTIGLTR